MSRPGLNSASSKTPHNSSAEKQDLFIYELPHSQLQLICNHLDGLNAWMQMATAIGLKDSDIQNIKRQQTVGNSPAEELLKLWGGQYNHTVTELFVLFKRLKLYEAMRLLKDFVARKYHFHIPNSQPKFTVLLQQTQNNNNNNNHNTQSTAKILNYNNISGVSNSNNISEDVSMLSTVASTSGDNNSDTQKSNLLNERNVKEYASCMLEINYDELTVATNNWSEHNELGKGGFGTVYQGFWKYTAVAIKQLHYRGVTERESIRVQIQQSLNELKYLNSCRHDNVLPLYGYSIKGERPCLVYQLMTGGSLEERLRARKTPALTWQQRIEICLGTARGINYLHSFREKPLIHGDIKPANVLLDQCLQPKIGDFGLAREGPNAINSAVEVSQVFGTKPYLPPEFLNLKKLSTQVDTYSFGVVLLETFTGLRSFDKNRAKPLLTRHIDSLCKSGLCSTDTLVDKSVPRTPAEHQMCCYSLQLGLRCVADNAEERPEMVQVLQLLHNMYLLLMRDN